jgi:beta-mannosidase
MFACAMYPGDTAFMSNAAAEAEEQIIRLRNHPSLALWCGNNESDEGWHNWGWQKQYGYSYADSSEIWHHYKMLFHQLLPSKVGKLDAARYYHPSSPANGWGRAKAYKTGDVHYWGVWWGDEPFKKYEEKVGRFVSEYGFQGFPSSELLLTYLDSNDLQFNSPNLLALQKHPRGFELIRAQIEREGILPSDKVLTFALQSALLQAKGIEMAIDAHRRNMPYCMGSLFWQWNDCWPSISWSAIDFIGKPKPVYYAVKRAFNPIRQQCIITKDRVQFLLISDKVDSLLVTAKIQIYEVTGQSLLVQTEHLSIGWGVNSRLLPNVAAFINTKDAIPLLMRIEVKEGEKVIDTRDYQLGNWKEVVLKK